MNVIMWVCVSFCLCHECRYACVSSYCTFYQKINCWFVSIYNCDFSFFFFFLSFFNRYILDYLRNSKIVLPENFYETDRLVQEATYFKLPQLAQHVVALGKAKLSSNSNPIVSLTGAADSPCSGMGTTGIGLRSHQMLSTKPYQSTYTSAATSIDPIAPGSPNAITTTTTTANNSNATINNNGSGNLSRSASPSGERRGPGFITVAYRGTFAFGRDGLADVKFRKIIRIIVCGKVSLCREVFKDTLNESRDPDRGDTDRYTSRFFLKHSFLEQAFDMLQDEGFCLLSSCGSGTNSVGEVKPGLDPEEAKWQHFNEFIFERRWHQDNVVDKRRQYNRVAMVNDMNV